MILSWYTSKCSNVNRHKINHALEQLGNYCREWKLTINTTKTVYTIFSLSPKVSKERHAIVIQGNFLQKENNPAYLGVILDQKLSLNEQMARVKKKANGRLKLVKKLASTSWGADKNTLRQLYLGYVRSTMDYSLALQSLSCKTTQLSVDRIQNNALRFISGAMRSTPTAACEVHTDVEPLNLRREAAVIETVERMKRQEKSHPNRKIVDGHITRQRIQKGSILSIAKNLKASYALPEEREPILLFDINSSPSTSMELPTIKEQLIGNLGKKDDTVLLQQTALATIDTYPEEWIHIYTDGSATNGTTNAGFGSHIQLPDGTTRELYNSCGKYSSNYEAETTAIIASLQFVARSFEQQPTQKANIVIFSDAKSVLQALETRDDKSPLIRKLAKIISDVSVVHSIKITLQWVPGHCNIKGNDEADRLAKRGAQCSQEIDAATMSTAKQIIKQKKKEIWMKEWEESINGRSFYAFMPTPNKRDCINQLRREEQVTLFRLRTRHIPLNQHLKRIGVKTDSSCPLCPCTEESVAHHLFDCPGLDDLRAEFLPQKPDFANTLYGTPDQLANTHKYHVMASRRRAAAQ